MQGERARGSNPGPQRAPAPPVTTRRLRSDVPDPGAASGRLPPFRPRSMGASNRPDIIESRDVDLEPIAEIMLDPETRSEPDASADINETHRLEQPEQTAVADLEETWLLDEVVEADAESEQAAAQPWPMPDDFAEFDLDITPAPASDEEEADEANVDEEPWDALGEALQQAVAEADPPLAEDLVRASEPADDAAGGEPRGTGPAPSPSLPQEREPHGSEAAVTNPSRGSGRVSANVPGRPNPPGDRFSEGLATTLESLAGSLRAHGINALDDAFARGDRLESSLALFLAGYRAGRGE